MAQQPHVDLSPSELPRPVLEPAPARRDRPRRPGTITAPDEKPEGGAFGTPGPDTGWALRILSTADLPEDGPRLRQVLAALMSARAAHYGRAPVPEDLEVALTLAGLGRNRSDELDARRERWVVTAAHEKPPGRTAVAEAGEDLFLDAAHADLKARR
jgi:hypothetical protein